MVSRPQSGHTCSPGWRESEDTFTPLGLPGCDLHYLIMPNLISHPAGTVIECECGKTWVAYKTPDGRGWINLLGVSWRREGRWARRRRLRGV